MKIQIEISLERFQQFRDLINYITDIMTEAAVAGDLTNEDEHEANTKALESLADVCTGITTQEIDQPNGEFNLIIK